MDSSAEKRMAGDYAVIHALRIGDREVVLGEDPTGPGDERYMCAFCQSIGLMAGYTEVMVSDDYTELVKLFGERVAEQAERTRTALNRPELQGVPGAPITAEGCEVIGYRHDLRGKVVVIKPEVLRPEYRRADCQLYLCSGGFGASPGSRGTACFCTELYSGRTCRFERSDILGTVAPEKLPQWAKQSLEGIRQAERNAGDREGR